MKVFIAYLASDSKFDNCIMEIEHLPQSQEDIRQIERQIKDEQYIKAGRHIWPYITLLNIIPVNS